MYLKSAKCYKLKLNKKVLILPIYHKITYINEATKYKTIYFSQVNSWF